VPMSLRPPQIRHGLTIEMNCQW